MPPKRTAQMMEEDSKPAAGSSVVAGTRSIRTSRASTPAAAATAAAKSGTATPASVSAAAAAAAENDDDDDDEDDDDDDYSGDVSVSNPRALPKQAFVVPKAFAGSAEAEEEEEEDVDDPDMQQLDENSAAGFLPKSVMSELKHVHDGTSYSNNNYGNAAASRVEESTVATSAVMIDASGEGYLSHLSANDAVSHLFNGADFSLMTLKADHNLRPLWINPQTMTVILEAFSPVSDPAQEFLVAISEPVSRTASLHEYKLTTYSLYAAASVGLETSTILEVLNKFSKTPIPDTVVRFVREKTLSFGKVKLVLKRGRYFLESNQPEILRKLLKDPMIGAARVNQQNQQQQQQQQQSQSQSQSQFDPKNKQQKPVDNVGQVITGAELFSGGIDLASKLAAEVDQDAMENGSGGRGGGGDMDDVGGDGPDDEDRVYSFEIMGNSMTEVKKRCNEIDYPVLEEYDFRNDTRNADLGIEPKSTTRLRPYQEKSLSKMFGNGRARSGIIVLPCGAGKTLVGITATYTVHKSALVLCTSTVSVMQWKREFLQWTNLDERQVALFTSDENHTFAGNAGIIISTYSMVANRRKRSYEAEQMMKFIREREWGFLLLDEVHVVPANMFRNVISDVKAHCKLGLTATLVREDDKIGDLNFLIGPKLYEANWMDLASQGHIANVQCAEVWCPMTSEFYSEYLKETSRKKTLLYVMNPHKFQACQYLMEHHERRGDKIIIFSDNVFALVEYARRLNRPFIHGGTAHGERMLVLNHFQNNPALRTILLSKVGDTSIDLPEATCLIQISSHYGSRRQEAQRLGRILRAKRRREEGFNAYFYSLVSTDTQEMYYSSKRQQFLVDQGYAFKVITQLQGMDEAPGLLFRTKQQQLDLLHHVLMANEQDAGLGNDVDRDADDLDARNARRRAQKAIEARRTAGSLKSLSGGDNMAYMESARPRGGLPSQPQGQHSLFKKLTLKK